ncbi:endonuclease MutS2 [Lapidilactobacillus mulanensis]|uniref:Endonuclease MutS2 n=1 Tax=Lapidilactobacillus mulanensis TaxID=2485999 RepID=A0ABW4DQM8_9LACO|nr:endonuclease MutS2 [Lapidilactobacillus mulanensis]
MNQATFEKLQFDRVKAEVQAQALGNYSKARIATLQPQSDLKTVQAWQQETQEARWILDNGQHVPFMGLTRIDELSAQVKKGLVLTPAELVTYADFIRSSRMIATFFEKNQTQTPLLWQYSQNLPDLQEIENAIYNKIKNSQLIDAASRELRKIRKRQHELEKNIQDKLTKFMHQSGHREMIQEPIVVQKDGHYTIPIKANYKNKLVGQVIDQSNHGGTVFMEPGAVAKLNEQLILTQAEATAEEYQILAELTGEIAAEQAQIDYMIESITALDIIFARAKYSRELNGITPEINQSEIIRIKQGRHPFLPADAVPLDFALGADYRGLVITGPNAGGKTVVLKTVGLLTLMTMFGLQIPAAEGTNMAIFDRLFVDIGDAQDLDNALSTFSGHMQNVAEILNQTKRNTLILLDEIGSGTEPNEGAALAIAIMESMYEKGALIVTTTHYGEIKRFAELHADFIPAAMEFDSATLTPKYLLHLGKVGDSQALWIAKKMKMDTTLIHRAQHYIAKKNYQTEKKQFSKNYVQKQTVEQNRLAQGDRVLMTSTQQTALVYRDEGKDELAVYVDDEVVPILRKRLKLLTPATELYPADYDLDSLLTDYRTRKLRHDLDRGSKKAQKELDREREERRGNLK